MNKLIILPFNYINKPNNLIYWIFYKNNKITEVKTIDLELGLIIKIISKKKTACIKFK